MVLHLAFLLKQWCSEFRLFKKISILLNTRQNVYFYRKKVEEKNLLLKLFETYL